jgi:hypothetical protein
MADEGEALSARLKLEFMASPETSGDQGVRLLAYYKDVDLDEFDRFLALYTAYHKLPESKYIYEPGILIEWLDEDEQDDFDVQLVTGLTKSYERFLDLDYCIVYDNVRP